MQFERYHPNNEEGHWHDKARQDQFQLSDDAFIQWPHFVDGYGDKKYDA